MDNRPNGREKHVTGVGKDVQKHDGPLNSGPVGRKEGYQGRQDTGSSGGTQQRSGGRSPLLIIILAVVLLFGGGGAGLSGLLGGGSSQTTTTPQQQTYTPQQQQTAVQSYSGSSSVLSSLLSGNFSGGGTTSTGWDFGNNTGRLNTSVVSTARAKRTQLLGNGRDTVTVMVYLCGTDLESRSGMATSDLQEMINANVGGNVNLLVYTGGCKQWQNNAVSSKVNQIYKVGDGGISRLVADDGSGAMTDPATLTRFIKYCTKNYPANRNMLIFWDHGGGSLSGYGYDEKNATKGSMTLKGINEALKGAGAAFDIIGFDTCLMATLENALMLDSYGDYMIASEETEPGVGWYYTNWLSALSKNPSISTLDLGKIIIDDFVSVCAQKCAGQKTTLSMIDLAELAAEVPSDLNDFATGTSQLLQSNQYQVVSDARSGAREFAASNRIDQVDVVHLAGNMETQEGTALAKSLLSAIKYNKTSSNMTNAYGLSIYFPYQRAGKVSTAAATYEAIGMDDDYLRCIQQFATMESGGQQVSGGSANPLYSLLGGSSGSMQQIDPTQIASLLNALMGGGQMGSVSYGRSLDVDSAAEYLNDHRFDPGQLVWTDSADGPVLRMSDAQWDLVHNLLLNAFLDDGAGYIDLGLDNVFSFTADGALKGEYDGTWLAIDAQPVAYYYMDSVYEGDSYTITGRVPVLLNGDRAELILVFDNENPYGYIAGARYIYVDGETETVPKALTELQTGDEIQFVCDYYRYDGTYDNSYLIGDTLVYSGDHEISNVYVPATSGTLNATYLFTDIYNQEYWTPAIP